MGDGMNAHGDRLTRRELARRTADLHALGGVRQVTLDNGVERGIRAVEIRTGTGLAFEVLVDRALDIGAFEHAGRSIGWRSATGFRHPGLHEYGDENGISWLRSFSGLQVTAGLDHTLFTAEVDASQYHYPHRRTVWNGLHGRVANIPGTLVGAGERWDGDRCFAWVEGEVRQAAVFGEHLRLRRRIQAEIGSNEVHVEDEVTNHGFDPTPHMYLYHLNVGWPLLDEGTRFVAPIARTVWQTPSVTEQRVSYRILPGPQPDFVEQVYEHELVADGDGRHTVAVVNDGLAFGLEVSWDAAAFPHFFEWLHLHEGAYAIGVEPSSHAVGGEPDARREGTMVWLEHAESRTYRTTFRVLADADAIATAVASIERTRPQPAGHVPDVG